MVVSIILSSNYCSEEIVWYMHADLWLSKI